jgi:hypothetical protein
MRGPIRSALFAAGAVVGCMLSLGAGSAMAVNVLTAAGGVETGTLRDDLNVTSGTNPPTNGQFGTTVLAQNTKGPVALTTGSPATVVNKSPEFDDFVGLQLHSNPATSTTVCNAAGGYVEFADFENSTLQSGTTNSPTYVNTLLDPFRVLINSASSPCTAVGTGGEKEQRLVTIRNVEFYLPVAGVEVFGTLTGKYVQPGTGSKCPAGGVELALSQPGLVPANSGLDNGTVGEPAFLCFVSANNYVYPTTGKELGPTTGEVKDN